MGMKYLGLWAPHWFRNLPLALSDFQSVRVRHEMVGIITTVTVELPLSGKYHRHGERLEFLITQAAFLKEQDLSNEHIWQKLLEYLVIFVNDLRIHDGIFTTKYSDMMMI